ncbi:MAG: hypothetical protein J6Z23_05705, partial [Lachnospiraceae bacterium]|nr:hypothetical protein [Lachnospiraceae bacterium]
MRKTEHRHAGRLSAAILALMLLFAASCMSGTPESVPAEETGTQTRSGDPAGQDGTGTESQAPELHGQVYSSIAQLFRETDPDWSESEAYTDAVLAYEMLVPGILDVWRNDSQLLEPHFAAAYIDADNVPEMLVSYGDFHLGSITIYGYDNVKQETFHAGDYGSFG